MHRFRNILFHAGTKRSETAVCRTVELAIENDARLTMLDVIPHVPKAVGMLTRIAEPAELEDLVARDRRDRLLEMASEYSDTGVDIDVVVCRGKPAVEIVRQVIRQQHDLVIKVAGGSVDQGYFFNGPGQSLMRTCPCPVWVLKPDVHGRFARVLAAVDMDDEDEAHASLNSRIIAIAQGIAERENAELHFVSACDLWMESSLRRRAGDAEIDELLSFRRAQTEQELEDLLVRSEVDMRRAGVHVLHGTPYERIHDTAKKLGADLVVLGTVCRSGIAGFLIGNTAEQLLTRLKCSVLTLKPPSFKSPITLNDDLVLEWGEKFPVI
jgi:nucleotide-binding universal stress UspA family protein